MPCHPVQAVQGRVELANCRDFTVTSHSSQLKCNFKKSGPTATATSSSSIWPPLTKICRKWRSIPWFMDWVWTSLLGLTTPNLSENWFKQWGYSNPHPPGWCQALRLLLQICSKFLIARCQPEWLWDQLGMMESGYLILGYQSSMWQVDNLHHQVVLEVGLRELVSTFCSRSQSKTLSF